MGKPEEERALSAEEPPPEVDGNGSSGATSERCLGWRDGVRVRCVVALVLGAALLLSAVLWLPPFLRGGRWGLGLGVDKAFGADIVASFRLHEQVSLLKENIVKLENDIFEEIEAPNAMVLVVSLEPVVGSNLTTVIFGVWPYSKGSSISPYEISLIRASFLSLVIDQSTLHLTPLLFGDSSYFQILKFPGGITVTPQQSAFPLQKVQILFNFTLNFSIQQIKEVVAELKDQLNSFLHLTPNEILYIKMTNLRGSTIAIPTIIQSSVLLAVGNRPPPIPRLKQLAQTIKGSPSDNLGLNHAVFGKVKQIQLSSYMQHSLTSSSPASSPKLAPAPLPYGPYLGPSPLFSNKHHHHHHQPQYHHQAGISAPSPTPVSEHSYHAPPPSNCWFCPPRKHKSNTHLVPIPGPIISPSVHYIAPSPSHADKPMSPLPWSSASPCPAPVRSPYSRHPSPSPAISAHSSSGLSMSVVSPSPSPSSSPSPFSSAELTTAALCSKWAFMLFVYLFMYW